MTYYHGTTNRRFAPGEMVLPGAEIGLWSNWTTRDDYLRRGLLSGRTVHPQEVVWITSSQAEALHWASHSTMKALPAEIRAMPAGGLAVYEVEPFMLDWPTDPHGEGEACCAQARVIREVDFEEFEQGLCDLCGDEATVGLGTDKQFCAECAAEHSSSEALR